MNYLFVLLGISLALAGVYFLAPAWFVPYEVYAIGILCLAFLCVLGYFLLLITAAFSRKGAGKKKNK